MLAYLIGCQEFLFVFLLFTIYGLGKNNFNDNSQLKTCQILLNIIET
jgi:hypothetical protein